MTTFWVFGESLNDTQALAELIRARAEAKGKQVRVEPKRAPLILQRSAGPPVRRANADKVRAAVLALRQVQPSVRAVVVAHEDCDDVEPSHVQTASRIESGLAGVEALVVAAAPAFEMEAWWYLWPEAVAKVCSSWRRVQRSGTQVGSIRNVKEMLKKELRSAKRAVRTYSEADAPRIARYVRELSIIDVRNAHSASFDDFDRKIARHI